MKSLLGEEDYASYLSSFDEKRLYGLRVNTLKISVEDFLRISPFRLTPVPWTDNGFYYDGTADRPARHPYYYAGLYYLQEPSAMLPAAMLPVSPGDAVLDLCAAPGGKSTELAAKLRGSGVLFSNDISNSRAQALLKNLELFGVKNAIILSEDPSRIAPKFENAFDKILIDAPCSGEGMFRKDPSVIKSWEEHGNAFYTALQRDIAGNALRMLKPGGMLLYSTCTFSPDEDENMVLYMKSLCPELHVVPPGEAFAGLSRGMPEKADTYDPELLNCLRIFPHKARGEGHFAALLRKDPDPGAEEDTGLPRVASGSGGKNSGNREIPQEALQFLSEIPGIPLEQVRMRGERLFLAPSPEADLSGLRVMRSGLYLGDAEKKRFEPSQALAMALSVSGFGNICNLSSDDPRVLRYLKGETLSLADFPLRDGLVLVSVDGFPLGFGKFRQGVLKNKYLPGWRYMGN